MTILLPCPVQLITAIDIFVDHLNIAPKVQDLLVSQAAVLSVY